MQRSPVCTPDEIRARKKQAEEARKKALRQLWVRIEKDLFDASPDCYTLVNGLLQRELTLDCTYYRGSIVRSRELHTWLTNRKLSYPGWNFAIRINAGSQIVLTLTEIPKTE